jgi:hypothetical protein
VTKTFFKLSALVCILGFLTACGTTAQISPSELTRKLNPSEARIIVTRDNSLLYMGAAADVTVHGIKIGSLGRGGQAVKDIRAGKMKVSVSTYGSFGTYSVDLDAKAGETYRLKVSPRDGNFPLVAAFGVAGDAVNSSGNDKSGYFQISLQ